LDHFPPVSANIGAEIPGVLCILAAWRLMLTQTRPERMFRRTSPAARR
jgi:hypothetical protein